MRLGKVIQAYRRAHTISVREFAAIVGSTGATICNFENGRHVIAGDALARILTWLLEDCVDEPEAGLDIESRLEKLEAGS